ncbi:metalloprotease [Coemansia furcata]|uniref:Metalloprotease n=1 Tax=Coemansia furcata TaxID=417177 RepID=A0ACC1LS52_9FUNG|nr:metalloprotease [Coemansia furcata]
MLVKARNASKDGHVSRGNALEVVNNFKPANWKTGFESKLTVNSSLPYEEYTGLIEKSGNDKRQYRLVRLPNNLVAVCIQDIEVKEAAASLSVNVGSNANPVELQGLAHFLEHMLFLVIYVTQRINQFTRQYRPKLQELTIEEFEPSVQSLISIKQEKLKSIDDEFFEMWSPINSDKYNFDKLDNEIKYLKQLSKDDLLAFWDKYVNKDTAQYYTRLDLQM